MVVGNIRKKNFNADNPRHFVTFHRLLSSRITNVTLYYNNFEMTSKYRDAATLNVVNNCGSYNKMHCQSEVLFCVEYEKWRIKTTRKMEFPKAAEISSSKSPVSKIMVGRGKNG